MEDSTKATESKDPKANVANLPGGCKSMEEVVYFVRFQPSKNLLRIMKKKLKSTFCNLSSFFALLFQVNNRIEGCIVAYKSKEETVKHLWEQFQVAPETTRIGK